MLIIILVCMLGAQQFPLQGPRPCLHLMYCGIPCCQYQLAFLAALNRPHCSYPPRFSLHSLLLTQISLSHTGVGNQTDSLCHGVKKFKFFFIMKNLQGETRGNSIVSIHILETCVVTFCHIYFINFFLNYLKIIIDTMIFIPKYFSMHL